MNHDEEFDVRQHLAQALDPLSREQSIEERVLQHLSTHTSATRRRYGRWLAATVTACAVVAVFTAVLLAGTGLRGHQRPATPATPPPALPSGSGLVWLAAPVLHGGTIAGFSVSVIDWSGAVRHHFEVPAAQGLGPQPFAAVSLDGSHALQDDGTVIDASGAVVARLPIAASLHRGTDQWARFADDGSGVCEAVLGKNPGGPGLTLNFLTLDGQERQVASVGVAEPGAGGAVADSATVMACSASQDLALVARYHLPGATDGSGTITVWALRLSSGQVVWQQPTQSIAAGRAMSFASANGSLLLEFLPGGGRPNERDVAVHVPSGTVVPGTDGAAIHDTAALSSDGSRILRRTVAPDHTTLQLLDASSGAVLRTLTAPGVAWATAVPLPASAGFLVQWQDQILYMDQHGTTAPVPVALPLSGNLAATLVGLGVQD